MHGIGLDYYLVALFIEAKYFLQNYTNKLFQNPALLTLGFSFTHLSKCMLNITDLLHLFQWHNLQNLWLPNTFPPSRQSEGQTSGYLCGTDDSPFVSHQGSSGDEAGSLRKKRKLQSAWFGPADVPDHNLGAFFGRNGVKVRMDLLQRVRDGVLEDC